MVQKQIQKYKKIINFDNLLCEINVWQNFRENDDFNYKIEVNCIYKLKEIFIKNNLIKLFPTISKLFQIYLTIPISPRRFSKQLTRIKTRDSFLTNRMVNEWNKLSVEVAKAKSKNEFKNKLDK